MLIGSAVADEESDASGDNDAELEVNNLEGFMNDLYAVIEEAKGTSDGTEGGDELACLYENVERVDELREKLGIDKDGGPDGEGSSSDSEDQWSCISGESGRAAAADGLPINADGEIIAPEPTPSASKPQARRKASTPPKATAKATRRNKRQILNQPLEGEEQRAVTFGPWTIAEIWATCKVTQRKRHIGWGATCRRHNSIGDKPSVRCQKSVRMSPGVDSEMCERMMKSWLIEGLSIENEGDDYARHQHRDVDPRELPFYTDEQLELLCLACWDFSLSRPDWRLETKRQALPTSSGSLPGMLLGTYAPICN